MSFEQLCQGLDLHTCRLCFGSPAHHPTYSPPRSSPPARVIEPCGETPRSGGCIALSRQLKEAQGSFVRAVKHLTPLSTVCDHHLPSCLPNHTRTKTSPSLLLLAQSSCTICLKATQVHPQNLQATNTYARETVTFFSCHNRLLMTQTTHCDGLRQRK